MAIGRKNAVPNVPGDTPRSLVPLLNALRENAQVMGGQGRGDNLDRAVTLRDLKSGELSKLLTVSTSSGSGSGSGSTPGVPGAGVPEPDDMPKPTGVYVGVTDYAVAVIWDPVESIPDLVGYHYSRIYRSSDPAEVFSEPAMGNTVTLVGQSNGNFEDITVTSGVTYYYWLRHVNTDQIYGPPSNRVTAVVPLPLTDQTGWVKESNLAQALNTRLDDIDTGLEALQLESGTYVTTTALANEDFATNTSLTAYVTNTALDTELSSYVTTTALANEDFATNTSLTAYVTNTAFGAVEQRMSVVEGDLGDIEAQYTIKLDVNGRIAGFGLMNDGATSQFLINAENIAFYNDGGADIVPFQITNNEVQISKARIVDLRVNRLASAYFLDLSPAEQSLDPVSNLGNLTVLGKFAVPNGTITSAMISPAFKDTIVRYNASAELFGGTRFETFNSVVGTYYAAKSGFTGDNAVIKSGASSSAVTIEFKGGVTWEEQFSGTTTRPKATFYVARKNLRTGTIENLTNLATGSTYHQVQGEYVNSTIPGEPVEHTSNINVTVVYTSPADFPTGTSGDEYEFWIVVTEVVGSWSTNGTTGGLITLTAEEEASSTTGVAVQSVAYKGVEWLTANDGNLGSGVSSIGALGSYWVDNFAVKIADSSGRLFDLGNRVYSAATFGKAQIDALGIAAATATSATNATNATNATYHNVLDTRSAVVAPNALTNKKVTARFSNVEGAAGGDWGSILSVKGWDSNYSVWEIGGTAANNDNYANTLKFRTGRDVTWHSWKTIGALENQQNWTATNRFAALGVIGNSGYFNGDANYTKFNGGNMYFTDSMDIFYSYAKTTYHGGAGNYPQLFRGNTLSGNSWSLNGAGQFTGNAATASTANMATYSNSIASNAGTKRDYSLSYLNSSGTSDYNPTTDWWNKIIMAHGNPESYYNTTIAMKMTGANTGELQTRVKSDGSWGAWKKILDSSNYNDYSPTKIGGGASGNWGISISGTAANSNLLGSYSHDKFGKLANSQTWTGANTFNGAIKVNATHMSNYGIHGGYNDTGGNGSSSNWGANIWSMGTGYDGSKTGVGYTLGNYCLGWLRSGAAGYNALAGEGVYLGSQNALRGGWGHLGFWTTGNITAAGTVKGTDAIGTSDIRVKSDLQPILDPLKICKALRTTTHIRSDQNGRRSASVIAQDVEKVLPEAIHYEDDKVLGKKLSVSMPAMNVLAIAGVNANAENVEELKRENQRLKFRLEKLEAAVEKLING